MAKKFFYVCAGLFLLALSYQLGARSANAQIGEEIAALNEGPNLAISTSGRVFVCDDFFSGHWHFLQTMTGLSSRPTAIATGGNDVVIATAAGDTYSSPYGGGQTVFRGNIFSGAPTASFQSTWGQVKDRYRK